MRATRVLLLVFALLPALAPLSAGQEDVDESRRNAIVRAIEKAAPGVVSVNILQVQAERLGPSLFRDFFDLFDFYDAPRPLYRRRGYRVDAAGSGFVIDDRGHIVTNYHVIEGAARVLSVTLPGGREVEAEVVGADTRTDIAVLQAKEHDLPYLELGDSADLLTGEWVIALGNPFALLIDDAQPSVSVGVVSANHRRLSARIGEGERLYQDMIQTDAAINPGNSGGPLVNAKGEVVGVNTMIFSPSGGSVGLGFAIPINRVKRVANEIIRFGRRREPWPGFVVDDVSAIHPGYLREMGVTAETGCIVVRILPNAPAYKAGLRPGDVITAFNGRRITRAVDIDFAVWDLFVGDKVTLEIDRRGKARTLTFRIEEIDR